MVARLVVVSCFFTESGTRLSWSIKSKPDCIAPYVTGKSDAQWQRLHRVHIHCKLCLKVSLKVQRSLADQH